MSDYSDRPRDASGKIGPKVGVEFMAPDGLDLKGDKGTSSVRWMRSPNGKICITAMNGVKLGDAPEMEPMGKPDTDQEDPGENDSEMA